MKTYKPLYRKINKTARNSHTVSLSSSYDRNTKEGMKKSMLSHHRNGYDYTPLYKFLLSKVGQKFDVVYSEAIKRLPSGDPEKAIFHIVLKGGEINKFDYANCGESSKYSLLIIDDDSLLQYKNPDLKNEHLYPSCSCCTHTFNGKTLINKYVK